MLFDTTQLALERTISGASQRHEALAANSPTPRRPATSASTSTSTARWPPRWVPRTPRDAVESHRFSTQADRVGRRRAGRRRPIDIDAESAKLAANALEQQAAVSSPRRATRSCAPPWVLPDEHVRRPGDLRHGAHRAAPADERHGREPRQRADHASGADGQPYRRKEVVLQSVPEGGFGSQLSRRDGRRLGRRARRRPGRGGLRGPDERQARLRPQPSRRQRPGLRAHAERRHRHRDGRPDRRAARL